MLRKINFKKGVSPVIGYILLITFVIIISIIIYQWVKTYIPREALECPDGVSIFIKEKKVDCSENPLYLNLTLKNNGRFNISGYFIRYSESPGMLATKSLWDKIIEGRVPGRVTFASDLESQKNEFGPGDEQEDNFTFGSGLSKKISFVEIIPVRYEEIDNRLRLSSCSDAKIIEVICPDIVDCEPASDPCNGNTWNCGTAVPNGNCADTFCGTNGGLCADGFSCSSETGGTCNPLCGNGDINPPELCDGSNLGGQTCVGLGYVGTAPDNIPECSLSCDGFTIGTCLAPDLVIIGLALQSSSKDPGNTYSVTITYDIENIGTTEAIDTNWTVDFGEGSILHSATLPTFTNIPPGNSITDVPTGGVYSADTPYTINVTADYYGAIKELSESNSATINIQCSGPGPNPCAII